MLNPKLSISWGYPESRHLCGLRLCREHGSSEGLPLAHSRPQGPLLSQPQGHSQDLPGLVQREAMQLVLVPEPLGQSKDRCRGAGKGWMLACTCVPGAQTCV